MTWAVNLLQAVLRYLLINVYYLISSIKVDLVYFNVVPVLLIISIVCSADRCITARCNDKGKLWKKTCFGKGEKSSEMNRQPAQPKYSTSEDSQENYIRRSTRNCRHMKFSKLAVISSFHLVTFFLCAEVFVLPMLLKMYS